VGYWGHTAAAACCIIKWVSQCLVVLLTCSLRMVATLAAMQWQDHVVSN
jgi:hypothetical protein